MLLPERKGGNLSAEVVFLTQGLQREELRGGNVLSAMLTNTDMLYMIYKPRMCPGKVWPASQPASQPGDRPRRSCARAAKGCPNTHTAKLGA